MLVTHLENFMSPVTLDYYDKSFGILTSIINKVQIYVLFKLTFQTSKISLISTAMPP